MLLPLHVGEYHSFHNPLVTYNSYKSCCNPTKRHLGVAYLTCHSLNESMSDSIKYLSHSMLLQFNAFQQSFIPWSYFTEFPDLSWAPISSYYRSNFIWIIGKVL